MSDGSKGIIISIIILILVVPAAAFGWNSDNDQKRIIRGAVYINGIPVGGQEGEAVRATLEKRFSGFPKTQVEFSYEDKQWSYTLEDLGVSLEWERTVEEALQYGRRGPFYQRVKERWKALTEGFAFTIPVDFDRAKAVEKLEPIQESVATKARDARYLYHNQQVEITPHVYGRQLDLDETMNRLLAASRERAENISDASEAEDVLSGKASIPLAVKISYPRVTTKLLKEKTITNVAGSYTTNFNTGQVGRSKNINIAAKYLDGYVILPGEEFSFNEVVGPRTKEAGFEEALIIVDDQFAPGLGGGVCQVSSTLYNSALRAGLKITERTRHSKVIRYVPVGLDAAVSYGYLDLKFINNTDSYIAVCAEVHGGTLEFRLLSERPNPFKIEVRALIESTVKPKTQVREDPGIPQGKEYIESPGSNGHVARVERIWYQEGREVKRETISRDFYPAEARVIVKGSQGREVVKPERKEGEEEKETGAGGTKSSVNPVPSSDKKPSRDKKPSASQEPGTKKSSADQESGTNNPTADEVSGGKNLSADQGYGGKKPSADQGLVGKKASPDRGPVGETPSAGQALGAGESPQN